MKWSLLLLLVMSAWGFAMAQTPEIPYCSVANLEPLPVDSPMLKAFPLTPTETDSSAAVTAYFGYNRDYLFVRLISTQSAWQSRDRGYQNGDGLHLVIAKPTEGDAPSREFYVLGFTLQKDEQANWQRSFVWYRNVDLAMYGLRNAHFTFAEKDKKLQIDIRIPWSELGPMHPWLRNELGFNLCYVHAVGNDQKFYHFLKYDANIQSEQNPREYIRCSFAAPTGMDTPISVCELVNAHPVKGDSLRIRTVTWSSSAQDYHLGWNIFTGENTWLTSAVLDTHLPQGRSEHETALSTTLLPSEGINLQSTASSIPPMYATILNRFRPDVWEARINASKLSPTSRETMLFYIQQLDQQLKALYPYETAYDIRKRLSEMESVMSAAAQGKDLLALRTGLFQRGFRSQLDNTWQPYSVYVPPDWNGTDRLPLIVFLHGSGQTDEGALSTDIIPGHGFFALAPYGRGTSNAYAPDEAQTDIHEAIAQMCAAYPVDTHHIILSGFSMGGYGVLKTWSAHRDSFCGLAIFSGLPNIMGMFSNTPQTDFTQPDNLKDLKGVPMFVFHGQQDRNCPFATMSDTVGKMKAAGADVEFITEPDKGHEFPSQGTIRKYFSWLQARLQSTGVNHD